MAAMHFQQNDDSVFEYGAEVAGMQHSSPNYLSSEQGCKERNSTIPFLDDSVEFPGFPQVSEECEEAIAQQASITGCNSSQANSFQERNECQSDDGLRIAGEESSLLNVKHNGGTAASTGLDLSKMEKNCESLSNRCGSENSAALSVDEDGDEVNQLCRSDLRLVDGKHRLPLDSENVVLCINVGGPFLPKTSFGVDFPEDRFFLGGHVLRTGEDIINSQEQLVYQTARYGDFSYKIHDLPPGNYAVDLHFAEIIFTNGPPGMRIFDVLIQNEKVVSGLDIYSQVGSNTPLVLLGVRTSVGENGLSVSFSGIVGSPILSGICVRHAQSLDAENQLTEQQETQDFKVDMVAGCKPSSQLYTNTEQAGKEKTKKRARKSEQYYEIKVQELKNECHHAWMTVQDCHRQMEKLHSELDHKSFHVDSLAAAVEAQMNELESERMKWKITVPKLDMEIQAIKSTYHLLQTEAHDWIDSFPDMATMTARIEALVHEHEKLKKKYVEECQERRQLYNKVLELKGNIRVFCRCRPLSTTELESGKSSIVEFDAARDNELVLRINGPAKKTFKFDRVFTPNDNQENVFMDTAPVVVSVLDGYNVCIFAYGQTGTGKTFTMEGTEHNRGVNYRTIEELFRVVAERKGQFSYDISVSVLEVYNDQIRDLLTTPISAMQNVKKLEIKQVAEGIHHVPGLQEAKVQSVEEAWDVLQTGSSARAVGSTNENEHSSRSHCMLCVLVKGENLFTGECTRSKLWLIDLAGSERVAKTDVQGERLKEAQNINKSLSALGDVIHALATKSGHIPYRNSKLTHLLQDSLGGESKTLMFVQISPNDQDIGETTCSLNFASRVRGVELGPARKQMDLNEISKYKQLAEKAKQEGKLKEDTLKKVEDNLKTKDQIAKSLNDKIKEKEKIILEVEGQLSTERKARIAVEGQLSTERKARIVVDCKVKEQQQLIDRLTDQLKATKKGSCGPVEAVPEMWPGRVLRENSNENTLTSIENVRKTELSRRVLQNENDGNKLQKENCGINSGLPFQRVPKIASTKLGSPKRSVGGRASFCVVPRRTSFVPVLLPSKLQQPLGAISASESSLSSEEHKDGNSCSMPPITVGGATPVTWRRSLAPGSLLPMRNIPRKVHLKSPRLQRSREGGVLQNEVGKDADSSLPPVLFAGTPVAWRRSLAPGSALRRSIPRKVHFRSPHLQPRHTERWFDVQKQPRESLRPTHQTKSGVTRGKPPTSTHGAAQRVLKSELTKNLVQQREQGWNRLKY